MVTIKLELTPAMQTYAQKARAPVAHLHPGLYALCLTQQAAIKQGQTIYAFKRRLFRLPLAEHLSQLAALQRPSDRAGHLRFATRQPRFRRVQFLQSLIHDVISERKYFLGIEFQRLREMQEVGS